MPKHNARNRKLMRQNFLAQSGYIQDFRNNNS
jgi:hypothetical protein